MAPSGPPVLEGVFAINKPPAISSAQVIRDVQSHFDPSKLFKPWLDREHAKRDAEGHNQRSKRKWKGRRANNVKMGHGGTLDPLATGVLILGVGSGTKRLNHFTTECTKTYEAVVLFGAATDTYDTEGKIVGRQPYEHITREMVEEALTKFRGKGSQKPPIFSALRMQGKRLYEYAREGLELPEEIKERPVEVHELEMLEWMDGGTHEWHWPDREAEKEEKQFADKILHLGRDAAIKTETGDTEATTKRKRDDENAEGNEEVEATEDTKRLKVEQPTSDEVPSDSKGPAPQTTAETVTDDGKAFQPEISSEKKPAITRQPCSAPACRLRMSVTSGFYVRSLCHDLGAAVGSLAILASLVRTRQGEFELGANVLWYDELKQGEDVWGPKVKRLLEESGENKTKPSVEKQSEAKPANANQAEAEEVDIKAEGEKVETEPDTEKVDIKTEAENFDVKTEGEEVDIKTEAVKASEQS